MQPLNQSVLCQPCGILIIQLVPDIPALCVPGRYLGLKMLSTTACLHLQQAPASEKEQFICAGNMRTPHLRKN